MDSVKWLRRIILLGPAERHAAFHESGMDELYRRIGKDGVAGPAVSTVLIKAAIAWPARAARLPAGRHLVWGFAWTGDGVVRGVDFSSDGGKLWTPAKLSSPPRRNSWVKWECPWVAVEGEHILMSRAIDSAGRQPLTRDPARTDGYELNWCAPVPCSVR